jgi:A/G-specific adenine glycosylase
LPEDTATLLQSMPQSTAAHGLDMTQVPPIAFDDSTRRALRRRLLRWYRDNGRDLPWRSPGHADRNPYHVLVSEAMLQQTQVRTVVAYYQRFIEALPTVAALARASERQVLCLWQGLGYYRRARFLHAAAKRIISEHNGQVPADVEALQQLPGVGRYTAGAVASIAFGRCAPILDGNVARVLSRWLAVDEPIDRPAVRKQLWSLAEQFVPRHRPGDFNEALMELGALICTPRRAQCQACPTAALCRAQREGLVELLPRRLPRRAPVHAAHHVIAARRRDKLLFVQRPPNGLWSNMWQLPTAEHLSAQADAGHIRRWFEQHTGLSTTGPRRRGQFTARTTHLTIEFIVWQTTVTAGRIIKAAGQWRHPNAIDDLPLANPQRKAIEVTNTAVR